jgi:hypothetical protein
MEFSMTGFKQDRLVRRYTFKAPSANKTVRLFAVEMDVTLLRKYGISLQEIPLLCCRLLEKAALPEDQHVLTFSEELMREHAENRAAMERLARDKRKAHRRPISKRVGQHWRGPQPTA